MDKAVKILILPIYRRYWLYHAWQEPGAFHSSLRPSNNWRKGENLEEKLQLLTRAWSDWIQQRMLQQWRDLEAAKDGSIKSRFYRLAQGVLSREDPIESFLKVVPPDCTNVELIYPSSLNAKLVRRRMRLLLKREYAHHRRRLWGWGLLIVPLIPLLATPVPNIPLYYAGYKAYSARRALGGCAALQLMWAQTDTDALTSLRQQLVSLQHSGVIFPIGSWPHRLIKEDTRYSDILANVEGRMRHVYHGHPPSQMIPSMVASRELDQLAQPQSRSTSAIEDDAVLNIAKKLDAHGLFEHMARARKRATGAMFPAHVA